MQIWNSPVNLHKNQCIVFKNISEEKECLYEAKVLLCPLEAEAGDILLAARKCYDVSLCGSTKNHISNGCRDDKFCLLRCASRQVIGEYLKMNMHQTTKEIQQFEAEVKDFIRKNVLNGSGLLMNLMYFTNRKQRETNNANNANNDNNDNAKSTDETQTTNNANNGNNGNNNAPLPKRTKTRSSRSSNITSNNTNNKQHKKKKGQKQNHRKRKPTKGKKIPLNMNVLMNFGRKMNGIDRQKRRQQEKDYGWTEDNPQKWYPCSATMCYGKDFDPKFRQDVEKNMLNNDDYGLKRSKRGKKRKRKIISNDDDDNDDDKRRKKKKRKITSKQRNNGDNNSGNGKQRNNGDNNSGNDKQRYNLRKRKRNDKDKDEDKDKNQKKKKRRLLSTKENRFKPVHRK